MKKSLLIFLGLVLLTQSVFSAQEKPTPAYFTQAASVSGSLTPSKLYLIPLSAEVMRAARPDLGDLRLYDVKNQEVPFVVLRHEASRQEGAVKTLSIKGYSPGISEAVLTLKADKPIASAVEISLNIADQDFRKTAEVSVSTDGQAWEHVASEPIYDFSSQVDLRKTSLILPGVDALWFRVKISDLKEPVQGVAFGAGGLFFALKQAPKRLRINGVTVRSEPQGGVRPVMDSWRTTEFERQEIDGKKTVITIPANIPAERIMIVTKTPYFHRHILIEGSETRENKDFQKFASGTLFRFPLSGKHEENVAIACPTRKNPFYRLTIDNGDNQPLDIVAVTFAWTRRNILFLAPTDGSKPTLCFGNPHVPAPSYDLGHFVTQENWHTQEAVQASLDPAQANVAAPKSFPDPNRKARIEKIILLTLVVILIPAFGFWIFRLMPKTAAKKDNGTPAEDSEKKG